MARTRTTRVKISTTRTLRSLRAPLTEWAKLNVRLGRVWSAPGIDDLPWWYNERALLSVLVGAIWRAGGDAFEEFSETKLSPTIKGAKGHGRIDLWFETSSDKAYRAEVKHREFPITKTPNQAAQLNALMGRAVTDAKRNLADGGKSKRLAIAFAVPYLKERSADEVEQKVSEFITGLEEVGHDAMAWVFPRLKHLPAHKSYVCPGIVVWIKIVRRS